MTISLHKFRAGKKSPAGFTLVEVIVAASIGAMILAGVLATFLMIVRSGVRASNYSVMEAETRRAFEQLGIDARMASDFSATFTSGEITAFTLTIPSNDLSTVRQVTYGYDASVASNKKIFVVPGYSPTATSGRVDLISNVDAMQFFRYNSSNVLIDPSVTSSAGVKHIQISVSIRRTGSGVVSTSQIIRSSAFTLRNISI